MSQLDPSLRSRFQPQLPPAESRTVRLADGSVVELEDYPVGRGSMGTGWLSRDRARFIKLYHRPADGQRQCLERILGDFNCTRDPDPAKAAYWCKIFLWPKHIVEYPRLGVACDPIPDGMIPLYCLIAPRNYRRLPAAAKLWNRRLLIAWRLANAVARMHKLGLAHSDLSPNNVVADPRTGRVRIIDLDSLVVEGFAPPSVIGTPGYIAPELLEGARRSPNTLSDRHALAVLIYELLLYRHPLRGPHLFGLPPEETEEIVARQFSRHGIYIAHPSDERNRPKRAYFDPKCLGETLAGLFERAFVRGLQHPEERPAGDEWSEALGRLTYTLQPCANRSCVDGSFPLLVGQLQCPWCGQGSKEARGIPVLFFYEPGPQGTLRPRADDRLPGFPQKSLNLWHARCDIEPAPWHDQRPIGRFEQEGDSWFLHNLLCESLTLLARDRSVIKKVRRGERLPLQEGQILGLGDPGTMQYAYVNWIGRKDRGPVARAPEPVSSTKAPESASPRGAAATLDFDAQTPARSIEAVVPSPAPPPLPLPVTAVPRPAPVESKAALPEPQVSRPISLEADEGWIGAVKDKGVRKLLRHLSRHGVATEADAISILGDSRRLRRFDNRMAKYLKQAPFTVRIESAPGGKRYIREY